MEIHSTTTYGEKDNQIEITLLAYPVGAGLAGMVRSPLFQNDVAIVVETSVTDDYNFACFAWGERGIAPRIVLWPEILQALKEGSDEALTVLFHELGHYQNGDYKDEAYIKNDYEDSRMSHAEKGQILPMELAADAFAARYLGVERTVRGLSEVKNRMQNMDDSELAISEIASRIAYLGG